MKEFWKDWKNKSKLEKSAISVLKIGMKILFKNIPKKEIVSIYVRGSMARREMTKKSDIDLTTIVKNKKYLKTLNVLNKKYEKLFCPELELKGYSLWELKTGKREKVCSALTPPCRFSKHIVHFKLVYGRDLSKEKLFVRSHKQDFKGLVHIMQESFIPRFKRGDFSFSEIVKQVFWLTENEEKAKGRNPPHAWKELVDSVKDKNHIVHAAYQFRLKPTKDKKKRARFIQKLEKHIAGLEKEFF